MIKKGRVYYKHTESWCGNEPKGTPVKVVDIIPPYPTDIQKQKNTKTPLNNIPSIINH